MNEDENKFAHGNIETLCRICLVKKDSLILASGLSKEILDMYISLMTKEVYSENEVPFKICDPCKNDLVFCLEFKKKCQKSDTVLKSLSKGKMDTRSIVDSEVKVEQGSHDTKDECEEHEDIQYLDDNIEFNDDTEDTLDLIKNVNLAPQNNGKVSLTDSTTFLKNISSKRDHGKRKKSYICTLCSKIFLKAKTLKAHLNSQHCSDRHPHSCKQCKESFDSEHDLQLHSTLHIKGDAWTCVECNKKFDARGRLRRHIQRHMRSKRHACGACGKQFAERYALRRHQRVHTGELLEKRHVCHVCDKRYASKTALATHARTHSGARPFACACGKAFRSQRLLASHRLVHSDRKPYRCRYCDKTFRHDSTRNTHHRTHTGERPYVCSSCGKSFIQGSNLRLHMRTHTGEKPYSCKLCDRKFSSSSTLANHTRTHTGEKPYSCPVCSKRFARMDMGAHMSQHTGERPHRCAPCGRAFASVWRLRQHARLHTGEKPFECTNCAEKFSTKSHLMKHCKKHEKQKKSAPQRELVIFRQLDLTTEPYIVANNILFTEDKNNEIRTEENAETNENYNNHSSEDPKIAVPPEMPLEVTEEVILQGDSEMKPDLLVVDTQNNEYQTNDICLSADGVNFVNDVNCDGDVNYVTLNEGGLSISSTSTLESATVKLYQLDQSLVQIHSSGRQLTISKITSKMTANF